MSIGPVNNARSFTGMGDFGIEGLFIQVFRNELSNFNVVLGVALLTSFGRERGLAPERRFKVY